MTELFELHVQASKHFISSCLGVFSSLLRDFFSAISNTLLLSNDLDRPAEVATENVATTSLGLK